MPSKPATLCRCGTPATAGNRCDAHEQQHQAKRNARRTHLQGDWPALSADIRRAWVDEHGWLCPGYQRPAHPSRDLTVDHVTAGTTAGGLAILCRSCNAAKGARAVYA